VDLTNPSRYDHAEDTFIRLAQSRSKKNW